MHVSEVKYELCPILTYRYSSSTPAILDPK